MFPRGKLATSVAASNQRRDPRTSKFRGWALATLGHLNHFNRPVRTRMPGGVGGARSAMIGPYPDSTYISTYIAYLAMAVHIV